MSAELPLGLIDPEETTITTSTGQTKTFILSKVPAVPAREILFKYPASNIPSLGDYAASEETMKKLLGYVAVVTDSGQPLRLMTEALINNHVDDVEMLARLEYRMLDKNFGFFRRGLNSAFSGGFGPKVQALISRMWTVLSEQLSEADAPRSTN
jgi:hypothetical protein